MSYNVLCISEHFVKLNFVLLFFVFTFKLSLAVGIKRFSQIM